MTDQKENIKIITITYESLDELFDRESTMIKSLTNYLEREKDYEFLDKEIVVRNNKYTLKLRIKLKD